jgi:hypothetical protein
MSDTSSSPANDSDCNEDLYSTALKFYQMAIKDHDFKLAIKCLQRYPELVMSPPFTDGESSDNLYLAIEGGSAEFLYYLVDVLQVPLKSHKQPRLNLFEYAVVKGQLDLLPFLREELGISTTNSDLLHVVLQFCRFDILKYLIESLGVPVEKPEMLFIHALCINNVVVIRYLYERLHITQVNSTQIIEIAVYLASISGDLSVLEFIVEKFSFNFDVREVAPINDSVKHSLYTALSEAVKREHLHVIQFAVEVLRIQLKTTDSSYPPAVYSELLRTAVQVGSLPIFRYLAVDVGLDADLLSEKDNLVLLILGLEDELLKFKFLREAQHCVSELQFRIALKSADPAQLALLNKLSRQSQEPQKRFKQE